MTSKLAKKAGLKMFEKHLEAYTPADPYYETYTDERSGKKMQRKREIPPGLSKRDAAILKSVKRRAHYLDKGFKLCGFQFGWTFIISFIPIVGDITDATLNYTLVLRKAKQAELPRWLINKMYFNNTVSLGVSFIPIAGDIILGVWKANSRNAALLEEFLRIRGEEFLKGESSRVQDPNVIKPGAGRTPDEHVSGKHGAAKSDVPPSTNNTTHGAEVSTSHASTSGGTLKKKKPDTAPSSAADAIAGGYKV